MNQRFDAVIIGTGQSGPPLAWRLADSGMKVAIVERKRFGGTCVNNGCVPTKTLVASAKAAHLARRGADFGVIIDGPIRVDMKAVKARKDAVVARSNKGVEKWMKSTANLTVFEGHARFTGPRAVRVGDDELHSDKIFINVGGRAQVPPVPGLDRVPYLNNSSMMDMDALPPHLLILGGSYIALEFGQMYRRFGSQVTIIERGPRILAREDDDVAEAVRAFFEEEGITVVTDAGDFGIEGEAGAVSVAMRSNGTPRRVSGSHLLVATGRVPNTEDLGLDKAGVETDRHGFIVVDDRLSTNVPGIWAIGDCNGRGAFTHTSYNDYEIIAANLLDGGERRVTDRIPAYALFIDPPLGRVGITEREARARGAGTLVARRPMTRVPRAVEAGETRGFMKILVDGESKKILGAALLGYGCDEVVHAIIEVMYANAPYTLIQRAVHIHPTVSEFLPTMLEDLEPLA